MKIYKFCPSTRKSKAAWAYFTNKNKEVPKRMWKMPNNFHHSRYTVENGAWGMYVAEYMMEGTVWRDYYDPTVKQQQESLNIFSFIKKQTILERLLA